MLKYLLILSLLLTTHLFAAKNTVFFHSKSNPDYISNVKEILQLSEDFVFTTDPVKARYDVGVEFHKLSITNTVLDKQTEKTFAKNTPLRKEGAIEEVYNKNTLNVLNIIDNGHDLLWIDDYFFEHDKTTMFVNKYFNNKIKTFEFAEVISQSKSFDGGRKIFLSMSKGGETFIKLLNTVTGRLSTVSSTKNGFLIFMDYDKHSNKVLFKELARGKSFYYETLLTKNQTKQPTLYNIDREIVQVKYFGDDFIVLIKDKKTNLLRIYENENPHMNSFKTLNVESSISDFVINGNRIVYKTMEKTLSTYNLETEELTKLVFTNVEKIENVSLDRVLVTTTVGNKFVINLNTLKNIQVKKAVKYD